MTDWDQDKPLPEDKAIEKAHPCNSGNHARYAEAMRLVSAKYSKGALVELVNWLLAECDRARNEALEDTLTAKYTPPAGFALVPLCQFEGTIHEAAFDASTAFWEEEKKRREVHKCEGASIAAFGAFIRKFIENSREYVIEAMAEDLWKKDYPKGGSMVKCWDDNDFCDKELYRKEAIRALKTKEPT